MAGYSQLIANELATSLVGVSPRTEADLPRCSRWTKNKCAATESIDSMQAAGPVEPHTAVDLPHPPDPLPDATETSRVRKQRASSLPSYILQHYHSTGCCGGAFSWRAAMLDPMKDMFMCSEPREYRKTTMQDIQYSLDDKRRGGGPRVGPFQDQIPGNDWYALPKYDFTTRNRSTAFNERMHVEWENHVDHILGNGGELPIASVVAKAGFRSCSPCCRDMLALARPTGKTFIMVDLAENDRRGTFHFVTGSQYLPVPKEACTGEEITALKKIVTCAQEGKFASSEEIYRAVMKVGAPIDEIAQTMYLGDKALLPEGCATTLKGHSLLEIIHAEHFARLPAEYGASILRDTVRPQGQRDAVHQCRARAKERLIAAWQTHLQWAKGALDNYANAAVAPLLPEDPVAYMKSKTQRKQPSAKQASASRAGDRRWSLNGPKGKGKSSARACWIPKKIQGIGEDAEDDDGQASTAAASTALPDDGSSTLFGDDDRLLDVEDPEE